MSSTRPRRLVTPGRVALLGMVAGLVVGGRTMLRSVRAGWTAYRAAPGAEEGPVHGPVPGPAADRPGVTPGLGVTDPRQIPPGGWVELLKRVWKSNGEHNTGLLAAGVTHYAFLSIFPALVAVVLVYGLVAEPADVTRQVDAFSDALPAEARTLIIQQLSDIASGRTGALSVGLLVAVLAALWTASAAINGLMGALNVIYGERDDRNIVVRRGTALGLTFGAVVFVALAAFLLTVLPAILGLLSLGVVTEWLLLAVRWVGLLAAFNLALSALYRLGPDRADARFRWVTPGALLATGLWILVSAGFSVYVDNFASYGKTYGALAGVVVLLLWLYFTSYAVLLGAEVNAQAELSTVADTTTGPPRPPGERGAFVADSVVIDPDKPPQRIRGPT